MALNREQKRQLKKRGELTDDGEAVDVSSDDDAAMDDAVSSSRPKRPSRRDAEAVAPAKKEDRTTARQFVKEVRAELRKVAWPTRRETVNYSLIVAVTLVFMTTLIFCLDWVFSETVLRLFNVK